MRNRNKLISLILALTLLVGAVASVFAFTAGAAETPAPQETFTPTATFTEGNPTDVISNVSGNLVSGVSLTNWIKTVVRYHTFTEANGNKYGQLTSTGGTTAKGENPFLNVSGKKDGFFNFDGGYYVIEFDMATESALIESFTLKPIIDFLDKDGKGGSSSTRPDASIISVSTLPVGDGNWHHITLVGDLKENKLSVYCDGSPVNGTYAAFNSDRKTAQDAKDSTTKYYVSSFRVDLSENKTVTAGNSISVDNFAFRTFDSASELTYSTAPATEKLPAIATIDGEEYSNVKTINSKLTNTTSARVELLRESFTPVVVNCNAIVETNGLTAPTAATGVIVTDNAPVFAYRKSSLVEINSAVASTTDAINAILDNTAKYNIISEVKLQQMDGKYPDRPLPHIATDATTGNTFLYRASEPNYDISYDAYLQFDADTKNQALTYSADSHDYIVFDFDFAKEADFEKEVKISLLTKYIVDGSAKSGYTDWKNFEAILNTLENQRFYHITVLIDLVGNKTYAYVNGVKQSTSVGCGVGAKYAEKSACRIDGVRFAQDNAETYMVDNVAIRTLSDVSKIDIDNLSSWSDAITAPKSIPPIATVEGKPVYSQEELNAALLGTDPYFKNVDILREGSFKIGGNAVVETFGFTAPAIENELMGTRTQNATTYTYVLPTMLGDRVLKGQSIFDAIKSNVAGNDFSSMNWDSNMASDVQAHGYAATDVATGNKYLYHDSGSWVTNTSNSFFEFVSDREITYNSSNNSSKVQYTVFDFDYAQYTAGAVGCTIVPNINGTSQWGANNPGLQLIINNELGVFKHITIVYDITNNNSYYFVDGVLRTANVGNNNGFVGLHSNGVDYSANFKDGTVFKMKLRLSQNSQQDFAFDNVAIRYVEVDAGSTALGNLTAALELRDISRWSAAITEVAPETAPIAKVDGNYVNDANTLGSLLVGFDFEQPKNVEILRDTSFVVNGNAVVETHGFTAPTEGANTTVTNVGSVYTYAAAWCPTVNEQTPDITTIKNATADSSTSSIQLQSTNREDGVKNYLVTDVKTGNQYLNIRPGATWPKVEGHQHWNWITADTYYESGKYFIVDFDTYTENEIMADAYICIMTRGSNGFGANEYIKNWNLPVGEWAHVTIVGVVNTGYAYVYVNGNRVREVKNGLWGGNPLVDGQVDNIKGAYFQGIRLNINTMDNLTTNQNFAIDNVTYRMNITDSWLTENFTWKLNENKIVPNNSTTSLEGWYKNLYNDSYELPNTTVYATVDNTPVNSLKQLCDTVSGNKTENVVLYRESAGLINESMIVETNGLAIPMYDKLGFGVVINGTKVSFTKGSATEQLDPSISNILSDVIDTTTVPSYMRIGTSADIYKVMVGDDIYGKWLFTKETTDAPYISYEITSISQAPKITGLKYYVIDISLGIESGKAPTLTIQPFHRNSADKDYSNGAGWDVTDYLNDREFVHLTLIGDYSDNSLHAFVNGQYIKKLGYAYAKGATDCHFRGVRVNVANGDHVGTSVLVDNFAVRTYAEANENLANSITNKTLNGWNDSLHNSVVSYPALANVNGVTYNSVSKLAEALNSKQSLSVEILRTLNTPATVDAYNVGEVDGNGFRNPVTAGYGYRVVDNNNGTYSVVIETREGTVKVTLNGQDFLNLSVLYGANVYDYILEKIDYGNTLKNGVLVVDKGDNRFDLYNATWNETPGGIFDENNNNLVYNLTATDYTGNLLVLDADNNVAAENTYLDALSSASDRTIILNGDVEVKSLANGINANKTVYLNGYTVDHTDLGNHKYSIASGAKNVTFIGGRLVDNAHNDTHSLFFAGYDFAGEFKFNDCDIETVANVFTIRGGTATFENCRINVLSTTAASVFTLANYYNAGYTNIKCVLNLTNTEVTFQHYNPDTAVAFVSVNTPDGWLAASGYEDAKNKFNEYVNANGRIWHEVNISGCTLNASVNSILLNGMDQYVTFDISDSTLNLKNLFHNTNNKGTLKIGNGVCSATEIGVAYLAEGVISVKTNNTSTPYAYFNTDNADEVTWADGTSEYWAPGSTPVRPGYDLNTNDEAEFDLDIKANVTLDSTLTFNLFLPAVDGLKVTIGNVEYDVTKAPVLNIGGYSYYKFDYDITPVSALDSFLITIEYNGEKVAIEYSIPQYCKAVENSYTDAKSVNLAKAISAYISAAASYAGKYSANASNVTVSVNKVAGIDSIEELDCFTGAYYNLEAAPKLRLVIAENADINDLVVKIGETELEYVVENGYVEITLTADTLLETITFVTNGQTGEYNFSAYCEAQKTLSGEAGAANFAAAQAYHAQQLLDALYAYAYYANAYRH